MKSSKIILNFIVILLSFWMVNVNAESLVNKSSYSVKKGEEITVFVDLDPNNNNKYNYSALLSYDNNVLEILNEDSFINDNGGANSLSEVSYEKDSHKYVLVTTEDSLTKDVIEIKFKAKDDIKIDKTEISFTNIISKANDQEKKLEDIKFDVMITDASKGNMTLVIVVGVLALLSCLALVVYNIKCAHSKKVVTNRKKVNTILGVLLVVFVLGDVITLIIKNNYKEEIVNYDLDIINGVSKDDVQNDDNSDDKTSNDSNVDKNKPETNEDITTGGNVNEEVVDPQLPSNKLTAKIVSVLASTYYPHKGETIELLIDVADVSELVQSVIINGKEYLVAQHDDGKYAIQYQVKDSSGIEKLTISELCLANSKAKIFYETSLDVLKEKPVINDFKYSDSELIPFLSFNVVGNDSFVKGNLILTDQEGKTVLTKDVSLGDNKIEFAELKNGNYNVQIDVTYDLDSDELNYFTDEQNEGKDVLIDEKLDIIVDYDLVFKDAKLVIVDSDGKNVTLEFVSTNVSKYNVSKVIINDVVYPVIQDNDKFTVVVPLDGTDKKNLHMSGVVLENNKTITDGVDATFVIFKEKPSVKDVNIQVNEEDGKVNVTYDIVDNDKVTSKQYAILKDQNGNILDRQELSALATEVTFNNVNKAGKYNVEIMADYDAVDGQTHSNELIGSKEFEIALKLEVLGVEVEPYPLKKTDIVVKYIVQTNAQEAITSFTVNGQEYASSLPEGNKYMITIPGYDEAGLKDINLTSVKVGTTSVETAVSVQVDVLKDVPTIDSPIFDDEKEVPTLSFNLNDADEAFVSGKITITNSLGVEVNTITINKNSSIYEIPNLKENEIYNYVIQVTYDLDTDKLSVTDDQNEYTNNLINGIIEVVHDYNFEFDDLHIVNVNKNEQKVTLQFTSTNGTVFGIDRVTINGTDYPVVKDGNIYTVEVTLDNTDETTLNLSNVVLKNGHSFEITENNTVTVFKKAPTVSDLIINNDQANSLAATFKLFDESKTVTKLVVQLRDSLGNVIETKELDLSARDVLFTDLEVGEYQIVIIADYDLVDGNVYTAQVLANDKLHVKIILDTLSSNINNKYNNHRNALNSNKDEAKKAILTYVIKANTKEDVKALVINGQEYNVVKLEDNKYQVTYIVQENAGKETIKVEKIIYESEEYTINQTSDNIKPTVEVEVLKRRPYTSNYMSISNFKEHTMTFKFDLNDPDGALVKDENGNLINAYATFAGFKDKDGKNPEIKLGANEVTFVNVAEYTARRFQPTATFDLDTIVGEDNYYEHENITSIIAMLIPATQINVHDIKTYNDNQETKYFSKGEEVKVTFEASSIFEDDNGTKSYYYPSKVVVNGNEYEVTKNGNFYTFVLPGYTEAGQQEIVINDVILNNSEEVVLTENNNVTISILKDEVSITDFVYREDDDDAESTDVTVSFNVSDVDGALTDSKIIITDLNGNEITPSTTTIKDGVNTVIFRGVSKNTYIFKIMASYNRGSLDDKENVVTEAELLKQEIKVLRKSDYKITVKDLSLMGFDKENKLATLRFVLTNESDYMLTSVMINGQKYNVRPEQIDLDSQNKEAAYLVDIEISDDSRYEVVLEKVTLENAKDFTVNESLVLFKNKPVIDNLVLTYNEGGQLKGTFNVIDDDETLSSLSAVLKETLTGNVLEKKNLAITDREVAFSVANAKEYTIEIVASYDLLDGESHQDEVLVFDSLVVEPSVEITLNNVSKKYPNKGETIDLTYNIKSNTNEQVTSVVIDNIVYNVEYVTMGVYKLSYTVPNEAGIVSLNLTKVNFVNEVADLADKPFTTKVDVLKTIPSINSFTSLDRIESQQVQFSFNVNDPDNALVSGNICINDTCNNVGPGRNTPIFNVQPNVSLMVVINIDYDLDTDLLNEDGEDENNSTVSFSQEYKLLEDYEVNVLNLTTFNKNAQATKYFAKNEEIQLRFNSTNAAALNIKSVVIDDLLDEADGQLYDVVRVLKKDGTLDYYYVNINGMSEAGLQKLSITSVTLESGKTIGSDKFKGEVVPATIDILKEIPIFETPQVSNDGYDVTIKFNVTDVDNALVDSYIIINDKDKKEVIKQKVVVGTNIVNVTLDPDNNYLYLIEKNYNLDSLDNDNENEQDTYFLKDEPINVTKKEEPNFIARHLTVPKRVKDGSKVLLTFENEVLSYYDVDTIRIDGIDYKVTKNDNIYSLELEHGEKGYNTIHVESVTMAGKVFKINRSLTYIYENVVPTVTFASDINEELEYNIGTIQYQIADPDNAIRKLTAYMKNSAGAVVATQDIELNESSLSMLLLRIFRYSIELKAEYDIGDGKTLETTSLFIKEKVAEPRVTILEEKVEEELLNKGDIATLTYKINTNIDYELKKIFIDENSYNVTKVDSETDDNIYQIKVLLGDKAGAIPYKVTKMQFGNAYYDVNDINPVIVQVKKDVPTLTHFIIDEKEGTLSFQLNDPDGALVGNSKFTIYQEDKALIAKELTNGGDTYTYKISDLKLKLNTNYNIKVDASYNLVDTKVRSIRTIDLVESVQIFERDFKLTGQVDYDFQYINRNSEWGFLMSMSEPLPFDFESTNAYGYKVDRVIVDGVEYSAHPAPTQNHPNNYEVYYQPKSLANETITVEKVILENGAAFDVNDTFKLFIVLKPATFEITDFREDINTQTLTFFYKLNDPDKTLASNLRFYLKDSSNRLIEMKEAKVDEDRIEFNIPNPPTSKYNVVVRADVYLAPGMILYEKDGPALLTNSFDSVVNTSILSSKLSTRYPKQGDLITIDYDISSSKVVLIDPEDHENQENAIIISSVIINDQSYDVERLDNGLYRVYYTVQDEAGLENIKITQINFSNNTVEYFTREDTVDVLKKTPSVINFKSENLVAANKVKFTFEVLDPDNVIVPNSLFAVVNGQKQTIDIGKNVVEFEVNPNELLQFSVEANYDLDSNVLNNETGDQNLYSSYTIYQKPFILLTDYNVSFNNKQTFNTNGDNTKYFEKNEDIKLSLEITTGVDALYPEYIVIDNNEYKLEKDVNTENTYYITIKGYNNAGINKIVINSITLNSGNVVNLSNESISIEVLKDVVKVESFTHKVDETNADRVDLDINVSDEDGSLVSLDLVVKDEFGAIVKTDKTKLTNGNNKVSFTMTNAGKYFVAINASYDRDKNLNDEDNHYNDQRIHYEIVTITSRYIEMKDVVDVQLYNYGSDGSVERVHSLSVDDLDVITNSLVKVTMKDLPTFYSEIASYRVLDGKLVLVLAYDDAMIYSDGKLIPLEVTLDILNDTDYEYSGSFKSLLEDMKNNPTKKFTLTKDYDLDDFVTDTDTIVDFEFKGEIDGNGHTISNLHKPLFKTLRDATIKNLVIKGVEFNDAEGKAAVTINAYNTTISNIHIDNITINAPGKSHNAAIAVNIYQKSVIDGCSVKNFVINTTYLGQRNSSIVSNMSDSKVTNCYAEGKITSGWHYNGALVSYSTNNSEISNNILNVSSTPYFSDSEQGGNGALLGQGQALLKNNLSLMSTNNNVYAIYNAKGATLANGSMNNYQLEDTKSKKNSGDAIKDIKKENINESFFKDLGFDTSLWNLSNVSYSNLPTLKGATASFSDDGYKPNNSNVYIPDFNRLSHLEAYKADKEITYHNMYKLMPFYDAKDLVTDGNKIKADSNLSKKIIKYVLPYDKNEQMISVLTTDNYKDISKISVVYEDGTEEEYNVDYDDYYGNVVSYIISDLNIGYNYNKFVIDKKASIIEKLVDEAASYEYTEDLDPITGEKDSRLYKEYFDNVTKNNIRDFIEKSIVNAGYMPTFNSDVLDNLMMQEFLDNNKLKQMLYAYNYYKYWYSLNMDGIDVADSMMFHGDEMFSSRMTMANLTNEVIKGNNAATNATGSFFNGTLTKYVEMKDLGAFLNYYAVNLTDYHDGEEWFKANWNGGYYTHIEARDNGELISSYWEHLLASTAVQNTFLATFTVPADSMYIIAMPTQVMYGSLRTYAQNPSDKESEGMKNFYKGVEDMRRQAGNFYTFAYLYVKPENMNPYHDINYDVRYTINDKGVQVFNNPLTTTDNYHKYFAEALNKWPAANGSGAYANGFETYWVVIKLIGSFNVATHETLHNQDSKVFLMGYGRRGNGEDYTAGNLQQYFNEGWISPNVMEDFDSTKDITQNFSYKRIDTDAKLKDYYQKMFEANDFLDYIEAKAFLRLTPDQQAAVAVQAYYPNLEGKSKEEQEAGDSVVGYRFLSAEQIKNMHLTKIDDLYDNHIMLRPGLREPAVYSPGAATDSLYNIHWYQPHADNDRPDGPNFKWLAWEMAGIGGYYDGYMAYFSQSYIGAKTNNPGLKTTDLIALRYITQNKDMTFRKYKLGKYEEMAKHIDDPSDYLDAQAIEEAYYNALVKDSSDSKRSLGNSKAVKKQYYMSVKRETNDFRESIFSQKTTTTINSEEMIMSLAQEEINSEAKSNDGDNFVVLEKKTPDVLEGDTPPHDKSEINDNIIVDKQEDNNSEEVKKDYTSVNSDDIKKDDTVLEDNLNEVSKNGEVTQEENADSGVSDEVTLEDLPKLKDASSDEVTSEDLPKLKEQSKK